MLYRCGLALAHCALFMWVLALPVVVFVGWGCSGDNGRLALVALWALLLLPGIKALGAVSAYRGEIDRTSGASGVSAVVPDTTLLGNCNILDL